MQTKITKFYILPLIFLFSACSSIKPFIDTRREAGEAYMVGQSTKNTIVICYNSFSTPYETLLEMANTECEKSNRYAKHKKTTSFSCSLLQPSRAYFSCLVDEEKLRKEQVKKEEEIKKQQEEYTPTLKSKEELNIELYEDEYQDF